MAQPEKKTFSSSRWWEFYAVRYGMGTVVGGVVFFFLCNTNPTLKPMLFGAEAGKIDGPLLTLLAGYGLAYCYIASAPILVLHAGRFLLNIGQNSKASIRRVLLLFVPPLVATLAFFFTCTSTGATLYFFSFVFALAALVLWPQYLAILFTLFRTKELLQFYKKLAGKRDAAEGGLVESYKHLREHGNSFSIVVLEIVLAIILFTAGNFDSAVVGAVSTTKDTYVLPYIGIILLWILPAALVWLVGTLFEREFSDDA
ncbi:hypothetical protein [Nitrosomonas sp. Nm132]|uniref:hypothetical protein n=1 Tax=Nitrosomonas sp. Nm132 TaxID=1881053 RepID=UPI00088C664B|nr:hypothetical protein [Nitrosomonas sp. Nm132]SDI00913.1 hypothetical protein SAMN05428952_10587 [Nitrosomonas sp. Nm132]